MQISELLATTRIATVYDQLQDIRQLPQNLLWSNRIPAVDAEDGEIMARISGFVTVADIVADDARAAVRAPQTVTLEQTRIPNLKHGQLIKQEMMMLLRRLVAGNGDAFDLTTFDSYLVRVSDNLRTGALQRAEALRVAMLDDSLTYDRLGIKMSGLTWGMPTDLKVTPGTAWSNTAGTPIADIQGVVRTAREKYGIIYDRISCSTAVFVDICNTDEFKAKAQVYAQFTFPAGGFPSADDTATMRTLIGRMLGGMQFEVYDAQFWEEANDGSQSSTRYLPVRSVILSDSTADGDTIRWNWANGVTAESIASSLASGIIGGFTAPMRGPVGYATVPSDLNPPQVTLWSVMRGFPRKNNLAINARLSV